jgi:16S rRNA (cytosine967-C5)-methyltransferase
MSGTAAVEAVSVDLRPGVQAITFHVWRNLGRAEVLRKALAVKLPPPEVDALLCTAIALLWNASSMIYDPHTLVNQTVEAAKASPTTRPQANFINACLRRFLRERIALVAASDKDPLAQWNHPRWWVNHLKEERPLEWESVLEASNVQAPMTLRVNTRKCSVAAFLIALEQAGIEADAGAGAAVVLRRPLPVQTLPGFNEGWFSVQDSAAQLAAPLLLNGLQGATPLRLLDACAAPGGKTGHLLELVDASVTALEIDPVRAQRIGQNLGRLGLSARILTADAQQVASWWDGKFYDGVLLDAPCTASGIVRRHPDVRWLRREADIALLAAQQERLLDALWPLVRPGGRLLYCTCSIFLAEGEGQARSFLVRNMDAQSLPSPGHLMPTNRGIGARFPDNALSDHDGFFYAMFQKRMA